MRDLLKGIDQLRDLTATFFYLKQCHCANGGHISTLSSPAPLVRQQHGVSTKKTLSGSKPSLSFGNKICHLNTGSIYQA